MAVRGTEWRVKGIGICISVCVLFCFPVVVAGELVASVTVTGRRINANAIVTIPRSIKHELSLVDLPLTLHGQQWNFQW